jgi:hypothetical protein
MKRYHRFFLTGVALVVICYISWAHASYTGRTPKSGSAGCGGCHASQSSAVVVAISGPDTLAAGTDGSYAVKISGGNGTSVCVDIATSAGSLKTADGNLKLSSFELITNGVKKYSSGSYTYTFKLTAPGTAQTVTLYATGMSTQSTYNFAPNKSIVVTNITDIDAQSTARDKGFFLAQNYPNPFATHTTLGYTLGKPGFVRLAVYDVDGAERAVLQEGLQNAGEHQFSWDGSSLPAGIYLCRLSCASGIRDVNNETIKLVLSR